MTITRQMVAITRLAEPQLRVFLGARDAFIAVGGSSTAPAAAVLNEDGGLCEVWFYKDAPGLQALARVRVAAHGAPKPVEWL